MSNRTRRLVAIAAAAVIAPAAAFGLSRALDDGDPETPKAGHDAGAGELLSSLGKLLPARAAAAAPAVTEPVAPGGPVYEIARARPGARIELRESPDGPVLKVLGARTEFDSDRTFYVAKRRGDWLGVPTAARRDNRLGWIRDDPSQLGVTRSSFSIIADLPAQVVEVRYGHRVVKRIPVTIGRAGSETPPGLFSVTDGLAGRGVGPYYGCCVMALSGHQPSLPPGWIGGDRIAIHGNPGPVGGAASAGCLRATNSDMVALFALVPLGTPVFIRA